MQLQATHEEEERQYIHELILLDAYTTRLLTRRRSYSSEGIGITSYSRGGGAAFGPRLKKWWGSKFWVGCG
jgi:hypothetical protein